MKWVKASASQGNSNCVEFAEVPEGLVSVRNSRDPNGAVLVFTKAEVAAMFDGVRKDEFEYLLTD